MSPLLFTLAQDANENAQRAGSLVGGAIGCCFMVVYVAILAFVIVGMWKVFVKARQPGWAAIIPIFNLYILCLIAGKPPWWIILFLIPIVNIVAVIVVSLEIAKYFGKSPAFAVGLMFLPFVFYPMLGFSNATYSGPAKPFAP
jgi:hypothetical protein